MKQAETALIIVDAQRGFMPATEGDENRENPVHAVSPIPTCKDLGVI